MILQKSDACETLMTRLCCHIARSRIPAERYLSIGQTVGFGLRHGFSIEAIARGLQMRVCECRLAYEFSESSTSLKFRALVEEWSWKTIVRAMANEHIAPDDDQLASPEIRAEASPPSLVRPLLTLPKPIESPFQREEVR